MTIIMRIRIVVIIRYEMVAVHGHEMRVFKQDGP